jgi:quercetin dioxygenase-like cupin family protein
MHGRFVGADLGTGLWFLNSHVRVAVSGDSNRDGISVLEHLMPCGKSIPAHVHHNEDEIIHVLDGEVALDMGGQRTLHRAGDTVLAPRGVAHALLVLSESGARCLTITRGAFEALVWRGGRPALSLKLPEPVTLGAAGQAKLATLCAAHGIELLQRTEPEPDG